ncbi:DMP19 family protein [Acinetobacter guillouiae]|uniref:DMP19 family protein n=1 Tax=Acinetobacter guillouiae TaxID=106649 RepID=UPI001AE40981|nr:DUF4375 domain-containing protein [Acinetobacter guillouiae]MBP2546122.1 hypothetical protein [Acinetobacter guillouiae]
MLIDNILISKQSLDSDDHYDVIMSNIDSLNGLFEHYVEYDEVSAEALYSYFVDYYLAQVNNGGFSQFVYNTGWDAFMVKHVREGLKAMNATAHSALFEQSADLIDQFSDEQLEQFLEGEYFGENEQRDILNAFDDQFYALNDSEDLIEINSRWLKQHPKLQVVDEDQILTIVEQVAAKIPNLEQRKQQAAENSPRYFKIIQALCQQASQELDRITIGDPSHEYNGQEIVAWHFLTDAGHFYMLDLGDQALMFDENDQQIIALDVSHIADES